MYKIYFDTSEYESKKRKTREGAILDAHIVALNGISYEYESLIGPLVERLKFMLCLYSKLDPFSKSNRINIKYEYQGQQLKTDVGLQLPGMSFIVNDTEELRKILNIVMKKGSVRVPFSKYFDSSFSSKLKGAYLVIENLEHGKKIYRDSHFEYPGGK